MRKIALSLLILGTALLAALAISGQAAQAVAPAPAVGKLLMPYKNGSVGSPVVIQTLVGAGARLVIATTTSTVIGPKFYMVGIRLNCGKDTTVATGNVAPIASLSLMVRLITTSPVCQITAVAGTNNPKKVVDGVRIQSTLKQTRVANWATDNKPKSQPTLVHGKTSKDILPTLMDAKTAGYLNVIGDVKLTSCTATGGSRENGSAELCAPALLYGKMHTIQVALVVSQVARRGGYCKTSTIQTKTALITPAIHHMSVQTFGQFVPSHSATCTGVVRAKLLVTAVRGNVVVHAGGTEVSLYR